MPRSLSFWKRLALLWIALSIVKVLLQPSYHSTDLLVHLHWKSLTREISQSANWYFDDEFVANRHTLDYPPGFAWWEAFWSRFLSPRRLIPSVVGRLLIPSDGTLKPLDRDWSDACLQLLPSDDKPPEIGGAISTDSLFLHDKALIQAYPACKAYLRTTVLLSDMILWWGAGALAAVAVPPQHFWSLFLSIVAHPALLWLDHVHFQYNGGLLGVWMLSLSCLVTGRRRSSSSLACDIHHLSAAVLFALLLTLKHLYLPLSLWYLVYLFRVYCYRPNVGRTWMSFCANVHWTRLSVMGLVTLSTLALPFLPILWPDDALYSRKDRLLRILERLFPFERGLCHDYWAGNLWAFYTAADKVLRFITGLSLPNVTPGVATLMLLLAVSPGAVIGAWQAASQTNAVVPSSSLRSETLPVKNMIDQDATFWSSLTFTTLASFATAYHGHEKAILTSLVPMTIGFCISHPHLVWRTHAFSLLSLLPLLYPATETLFKLISMVTYLSATHHIWIGKIEVAFPVWESYLTILAAISVVVTTVVLEGPYTWWGRYRFAPLAMTSLVSATGLSLLGWGQVGYQLRLDCRR